MTGGVVGAAAIPNQITAGTFFIDIGGQIILGSTQTIEFTFNSNSLAGVGSIAVVGWFENPDERL